jgi:hypothetical protein
LVTTPEEFDSIAADLRAVRSVSRMEVTPGRILRPV